MSVALIENKRGREIHSLIEIGKRLNEARNLEGILDLSIEESLRILPQSEKVSLRLKEGNKLVRKGYRGVEPTLTDVIDIDETSVTGRVALYGKPLQYKDVAKLKEGKGYKISWEGTRSELCVPIINQNELIGTINHESGRLNAYTEVDERLLMIIANQAALAILNARKFAEADKKLVALTEIIKIINEAWDLDKIFKLVMNKAIELTGANYGHLFLYDSKEGILRLRAYVGESKPGETWKLDKGIIGKCTREKETQNISDVSSDGSYMPIIKDTASELAVPIIYRGDLEGVLNLEAKEKDYFDKEKEKLMEIFVRHIANAINNAERVDKTFTSIHAILSHTLRNKLTFIPEHIDYLKKIPVISQRRECLKRLDQIKGGIERSTDLINKSLPLWKEIRFETINANNVIEDTLEEIENREDKRIKARKLLDEELPQLWANSELLKMLFENIILNAYQAVSKKKKGEIEITSSLKKNLIEIKIKDNGCGISKRNLNIIREIKEPSFTTKKKEGGTGFGLWSAYQIMNILNGKLKIDSKWREGTTVTLSFATPVLS